MSIKDIAKIAGVGIGTVSRVINNHPDVSDKTRAKVLKVIDENNYVPNNSARFLKMSNTKNIGVLVRGVFNPFFSEIIDIIRKRLTKEGYFIILQQNDCENEKKEINAVKSFVKDNKLRGLISLGARIDNIDNEVFKDLGAPIIFASAGTIYNKNIDSFSTVTIDNEKAAYEATEYLIKKGHKNIAIILGDRSDKSIGYQRFKGYLKALLDNDVKFSNENVIYGMFSCEKSYEEIKSLLEVNKNITAIFSISDIMSIGAAKAIVENNITVGRDISILGFDGMDIAKFYNPSLSTMSQPKGEIAEYTADLMLKLIKEKCPHEHRVLETTLIERDSTPDI